MGARARAVAVGIGAVAAPALAATPHKGAGARHFNEVEAGIQLSVAGNRFEDTYKVKP